MSKPLTPLQQRDAIEKGRADAYRLYSGETTERLAAERRIDRLEVEIRGQSLDSSLKQEEELETAKADFQRHLARSNSALDKVKAYEAELDHLYEREFPAFAEEADAKSDLALRALEDLVTEYTRAKRAHEDAQRAWAGPCRAVRAQGVGAFPIPESLIQPILAGEVRASPPGIEVFGPGDTEVLDATLHD